MVDIVIISDAIFQMHIVVNGSQNIFFGNMLRNKIMDISLNSGFDVFEIIIFFQDFFKHRIVY